MYFSHHITPLASHIRGNLLQLILPHVVDQTFMAFPIPLQTLWTTWTYIILWCSKIIPKNCLFIPICNFKEIRTCICSFWPQTRVHQDVCKMTNIFGVFLIWVWITWLLAFQIPWERSYLTLQPSITFLECYIRNPLGYIEGGEIEE